MSAFSRNTGDRQSNLNANSAAMQHPDKQLYPPVRVLAAAIQQHVFAPNGGCFDLYVFSWQPVMREDFEAHLYPLAHCHVEAVFEDNRPYEAAHPGTANQNSQWGQISYSIALSRGAMLVLQDTLRRRRGQWHERVLFVRPDLLWLTDFVFAQLPAGDDIVYVECCMPSKRFPNKFADAFHLTSGVRALRATAGLATANAASGEALAPHSWTMKRYNESGVRMDYAPIVGGWDESVYRGIGTPGHGLNRVGWSFYRRCSRALHTGLARAPPPVRRSGPALQPGTT